MNRVYAMNLCITLLVNIYTIIVKIEFIDTPNSHLLILLIKFGTYSSIYTSAPHMKKSVHSFSQKTIKSRNMLL